MDCTIQSLLFCVAKVRKMFVFVNLLVRAFQSLESASHYL